MYSEQEQEERDYDPQSDLLNAYAQSQAERKPDDSGRINALVTAGRFVAVCEGADYCSRTDAILGSRKIFLGDFATRAEAEAALPERYCDEISYYVLPYGGKAVQYEDRLNDSDIPF